MLNNNYICALDIGSSKIAASVAKIKRRHITNIYFESVRSKGIKSGIIVDSLDLGNCISEVLKNLKAKSSINIKLLYTNISGQDIVTKHSRASIALAQRGNKVITVSDIKKVNEQAQILGADLEEEIIQSIPFDYTVDSRSNILNPLGLYSHKLEVDLYLICARLSTLQSLSRVINQAGYEIKDLFFSGLATSSVVLNREFQEEITILCDIGADLTELLIFKDGMLKEVEILNLGGDDLTNNLSDELKIPFDLAEDIKRSYGMVGDYSSIKEDKEILVKKSNIYRPLKQKLVSEIITAKAKSICRTIKEAIEKKVDYREVNNFVAAGRTILLEGFLETLENILGISVKMCRINDREIISLVNQDDIFLPEKYLIYLTALGIICQVLKGRRPQNLLLALPLKNPIVRVFNKLKEVYQEYF